MITSNYAVTFEYTNRAPLTYRGTVSGPNAAGLSGKAIRIAQKALTPRAWDSCVCCLIDRQASEDAKAIVDPALTEVRRQRMLNIRKNREKVVVGE